MPNPWDLTYADPSHFSMEEFKGRQLVSGRRPQDVQEDVRQLTALQKADSTPNTPQNLAPWEHQYAKPDQPPWLQSYAPTEANRPLPGAIPGDTRVPWARSVDTAVDTLLSPISKGLDWYNQNIATPFRQSMFKEDPLETIGREQPMTPGGKAWQALREAGVGMLADPSMALGAFGRMPRIPGKVELSPPPIESTSLLPALRESPTPVLEPDAILGPTPSGRSPITQVNPKVPPSTPPTPQPNIPIQEIPGLKPDPSEPLVGQAPSAQTASRWKQWWNREKMKWGMERPVLEKAPESPVITSTEAHHVWTESQMEDLMSQPWAQTILKQYDATQWKQFESQAVQTWKAGGETEKSYQAAVQQLPPEFQQMLQRRDLQLSIENEIRTRRGLDKIPLTHEPYFPRVTTSEWKELRSVYGQGQTRMGRTTVGGHQEGRFYETMREGEQSGVEYKDPRHGFLSREANGFGLQSTDQMITGLEQAGVLHPSKRAALAASPTGEVQRIEGIPFGPDRGGWWVRTKEEAQFLRQNMASSPDNELQRLANTFFRGPSLIWPYPHIIKNMAYKLGMQTFVSKGSFKNLPLDINDYLSSLRTGQQSEIIQRFRQVMPFTESGKNLHQIMAEQVPGSGFERVENALSTLNKFSQEKIFAKWDPAFRYAKWREYVRQGMSDQEAANHTWIDLIRYGTRSSRIDFWRSLPMNFFVPWRVGTVRTLQKALQSNPVRLGAFLGFVDALREIDYRYNARWTHTPLDYVERPLMELIRGNKQQALKTIIGNVAAGPGGDQLFRSIETVVRDLQLKDMSWKDAKSLFWGLAQVYDAQDLYEKGQWMDLIGLLALGRHATPYGAPPRFLEGLSNEIIPTSPVAQQGELRGKQARGEVPKGQGIPHMGMK